jgi:RNA polymerase sigma-70 factor (ECF subfamily)
MENPTGTRSARLVDAELLGRLRAGDDEAFEFWVERETPRVLAVSRRILRCEQDAEDSAQDAFIAAFRALPEFNGESALSTWLHRIAVNCALMRLRARRRRREEPIEVLAGPAAADRGVGSVPVHEPYAEERLDGEQMRVLVRACIERLPEGYRAVLVLRDLEGLDTAAAARELGLSTDALKMRLHRARQALRGLLVEARLGAGAQGTAGTAAPRALQRCALAS